MSKVSVNIVTCNSMRYLPELLASLREQTFRDFSVLVIDNASTDGVIEFVREEYPEVSVIRNANNNGFAGGHNQGIKYAFHGWRNEDLAHRYVLVINPDIILTPECLAKLVAAGDLVGERCGALGAKLLRVTREGDGPLSETSRSSIIDSTGLVARRSRRISDRGAGELDRSQYDGAHEVFGISGAFALYRASALEAVRIRDDYFDTAFFAYKEDADMAWRLRLAGFGARIVPESMAYHFRRVGGRDKSGMIEWLKNRRGKSSLINFYSYRNHLAMLIKNEHVINALLDLPWIVSYEIGKFFSILFFEPKTLAGVASVVKMLPELRTKRRMIMAKRRISAREMRTWLR